MTITTADLEQRIRQLSRDEAAYKELLALFQAQQLQRAQPTVNMDQLSDVVFETDAAGRWTYLSPTWERMTGFSVTSSLGAPFLEYVHPGDRAENQRQFDPLIARQKETCLHTVRYLTQDGGFRHVEVHARLVRGPQGESLGIVGVLRDVTRRVHAQMRLKDDAANLRALLNAHFEIAFLLTPDGTLLAVNTTMAQRFGFSDTEMIGMNVYDLLPADVAAQRRDRMQTVIDTGLPLRFQDENNGRVLDNLIHPIKDETGRVDRLAVYAQDITARVQAEKALRESEERFHRVFDANPNVMLLVDLDQRRILDVNAAYERVLGYRRDDVIGEPGRLGFSLDPALRDALVARMRADNHTAREEITLRHADGHTMHVLLFAEAIQIQQQPLHVITLVDISERKRLEEALRDAYARYESLADSITDVFFAMDPELRYTFWNAASERLTGISAEVAVGKSLYDLFPDIRGTETEAVYLDVLRTGDPQVIEASYRIGQHELALEINVYPAANGIAVLTRDVTEVKAAQEQAFTLALEQARMRLLTDFIQHAAHEFRTPLSIIGTSTHLMLRTSDRDLAEQKAQQVSTQVKRIASLVDMLLLMVRLESSQETPRSHVNLNLLLSQVLEEFRVRYPNRPQVTQRIAADLPEIMGSADYLAEAFEQILDNAYRFTGPDAQISLYAGRINGYAQVQIADNGPGISADDQPHLFELFWRKDSMGSTPGFGLGLAITRRIVLMHGGRLWVDSTPGQGSTFVVELPI